jgi:hypothetical protein
VVAVDEVLRNGGDRFTLSDTAELVKCLKHQWPGAIRANRHSGRSPFELS